MNGTPGRSDLRIDPPPIRVAQVALQQASILKPGNQPTRGALRQANEFCDPLWWAISAISDEEPAKADPLVASLRLSAEYLGMRWGGSLLGYANRPGDVLRDATALRAAATFFNQPAAEHRIGGAPRRGRLASRNPSVESIGPRGE